MLAVDRLLRRVAQDGIHPAVGEVTAEHHPRHLVPVETSRAGHAIAVVRHRHIVLVAKNHRAAGATVARRHLAPAGMTGNAMVAAVVMDEIVMSHLHGMVDAATRFRGRHHVGATSVSVPQCGRAPWTVIAIMTAGEMIHETGIGIAGADLCLDMAFTQLLRILVYGDMFTCASPKMLLAY
jgi:hypothetical protein